MCKKRTTFFLICLLAYNVLNACRYTVREIGYSVLSATTYVLYYVSAQKKNVPPKVKHYYAEANVKTQSFVYSKSNKNRLTDFIKENKIKLPAYILSNEDRGFIALSQRAISKILQSSLSVFLQNELPKRYAVVLLLEGTDTEKNEKARTILQTACNKIENILPHMPKVVHQPPVLKVISNEGFQKEKILFWSAGVEKAPETPQTIILYGRGRMMGGVLNFEKLQKKSHTMLSIIGADCECGLDRKWMLGHQILLNWQKEISTYLNKDLGFDVENPMVLNEMSRILATENKNPKSPDGVTYTPTTINLDDNLEDEIQQTNTKNDLLKVVLYSLIGLASVLLIAGLVIFLRQRK